MCVWFFYQVSSRFSFIFLLYSFVLCLFFHYYSFFGMIHSNRIIKAEKFSHQWPERFIRYWIKIVLPYILSMCACVQKGKEIVRAWRKGCPFYFLSLLSHTEGRSERSVYRRQRRTGEERQKKKRIFLLASFLIKELAQQYNSLFTKCERLDQMCTYVYSRIIDLHVAISGENIEIKTI